MKTFDTLSKQVIEWAKEKDLLKQENSTKQMLKVLEEVGETSGALLKQNQKEIKDGIGDSFVTLIILSKQLGYAPEECLEVAWNEIKDRKGELKDGIFVKDEENSYIYESPDKGKTVYRRKDGETTREQI